jgi:hypothetical protein
VRTGAGERSRWGRSAAVGTQRANGTRGFRPQSLRIFGRILAWACLREVQMRKGDAMRECPHCGLRSSGKEDLIMHVAHFCRRAASGAVAKAREDVEVPKGSVRYKIPQIDPLLM